MNEPGWLTFYTASRITKWWLGVNEAEARIMLRLACAEQKIQSMKAPCDELGNPTRYEDRLQILPIEFWTRVAPSDWREREVDYDGPDADGCHIEVMLNETEFLDWLIKQPPDKEPAKSTRKRDLVQQAINALWQDGIPRDILNKQLEKQVAVWIADHCKRRNLPKPDISRDTILRTAGRK